MTDWEAACSFPGSKQGISPSWETWIKRSCNALPKRISENNPPTTWRGQTQMVRSTSWPAFCCVRGR